MSVGESPPRIDGLDKVTGRALYPDDAPSACLHARLLFSGRPHARLLALGTESARALPGVVAVLCAQDVPSNVYGLSVRDQPVFVGPVSAPSSSPVATDVSRWEGDRVALVVAETEAIAADGCRLIEVDWEDLPPVLDPEAARRDEVLVRPDLGSTNTLSHLRIRKGDMAAGWEAADVVVEGVYELPYQEHAYLQTESATSWVDDEGRVTVEVAGQWAHGDRAQIASTLDLAEDRVRVVYPTIGGAFGGREDVSLQIVMALAAWRLHQRGEHRAIRARWTREQSIIGHFKRHRVRARTRWGATAGGQVTAVEAEIVVDAGAYHSTSKAVLGNLQLAIAGPYVVENAHIDGYAVFTNNPPGGAARGFGVPQACFVAECQMNKLAEALGFDPVALRLRNALIEGSRGISNTVMPAGVSLEEVVRRCAAAAGGDEAPTPAAESASDRKLGSAGAFGFSHLCDPRALRRGRGFACGFKNIGYSFGYPERSESTIELHGEAEIERAVLRHAAAEVGQGAHTVCRQMAATALGVPLDRVELVSSDTSTTGDAGSCSASRVTLMAGRSIQVAAAEALSRWQSGERPAVATAHFSPPPTQPLDAVTGESFPHFAYAYFAEWVELVVDIETGHIHVERVVCADDAGRAIHPQMVKGQLEGGVVQAIGYALTEDLRVVGGRVRNPSLSRYLIPTVMDVPDKIETVVVEVPDPLGPWGARGVGEAPFIALGPAIVAALHDATGVWFDELPLLPERVVARLATDS